MKTGLVWFKTDLRLDDNECLYRALKENDLVIPFYCIDRRHFENTPFGFKKTGPHRARFLLESLKDIDYELRALGSGLWLCVGEPETELLQVVKQHGIKNVYVKKEVAQEELDLHARAEALLWKEHCAIEVYSTSTLYQATDLPFSIKDIPEIFTTFRTRIEKEKITVREPFDKPLKINSPHIPLMNLPTLDELGLATPLEDQRSAFPFKGGETQALKRLDYYFNESQLVLHYKDTRNGLIGADYSSKFSPWLALGCLSPKRIYYELKQTEARFGANDSTYWLYFEMMWRDYFRFMMKKHHYKYFQKFGIKGESPSTTRYEPVLLEAWMQGKTGEDFVDANMLELQRTGFMSNRGRQNVASYFCNDLKLDWRYGAAYFEEQLIDYDVSSNWGNWVYVAGVGNDPRGKRYFKISGQAERYDKDGEYRKLWLEG